MFESLYPEDLGIGKLFGKIRDAAIVAEAKTGCVVLWNEAATSIFGYPVPEALELHVEALVPEHLKPQHRAGIARYAQTGRGTYIESHGVLELPALRKGGEKIFVELSLNPIDSVVDHARGKDARYVLAIIRDVTERKRAEEAVRRLNEMLEGQVIERTRELERTLASLKQSEERFRSLVQNASDIITVLEADGTVRYVSPAVERLLGHRPEELMGTRAFEGVHPDDAERARDLFGHVY